MAKRRILKKEIYYTFGDLFFDLLICQHFVPNVDKSKVESIISDISVANNEFINRAHYSPKGTNKKEVKAYFNKLYADLDQTIEEISKKTEALTTFPDNR